MLRCQMEWESQLRTEEEVARRRFYEEPMTSDPVEEAWRLARLITWMLSGLRALRGDQMN